jgi:pentatricopeptide repeat protein
MEIDPAYETFTLNYVHVHYQWVENLCKAGRFEEALKILAAAAGEQPNQKYFRQATEDIHRRSKRTPHAQSGNNSSRDLGQTAS